MNSINDTPQNDVVIIEFPISDDDEIKQYQEMCALHSLQNGEAAISSHLLFHAMFSGETLQANIAKSLKLRKAMEEATRALIAKSDRLVVYCDKGITPHMSLAIQFAEKMGVPVSYRSIKSDDERLEELKQLIAEKRG